MISIVMTVYNKEIALEASISSVRQLQTDGLEIIIVDDGSSDGSQRIIEGHAAQDTRISFLQTRRLGASGALNAGIESSRGTFIAINDGDDMTFPWRLALSSALLEVMPEAAFVGSRPLFCRAAEMETLFAANANAVRNFTVEIATNSRLYRGNPFCHSSVMFRKQDWALAGGYPATPAVGIDVAFYERILRERFAILSSIPFGVNCLNSGSVFRGVDRRERMSQMAELRSVISKFSKVGFKDRVIGLLKQAVSYE